MHLHDPWPQRRLHLPRLCAGHDRDLCGGLVEPAGLGLARLDAAMTPHVVPGAQQGTTALAGSVMIAAPLLGLRRFVLTRQPASGLGPAAGGDAARAAAVHHSERVPARMRKLEEGLGHAGRVRAAGFGGLLW